MGTLLMLQYFESIIHVYFRDFLKKKWLEVKYYLMRVFCYLDVFYENMINSLI
jgi:hypothetical protein